MNKIEVKVLHEGHDNPEGMMMFLAKLTQRGHKIHSMDDLVDMYNKDIAKTGWKVSKDVAKLPHGTIKRMTPVTIAIVGASRRFLAQARTHNVGLTFVSASLQYSDYSNNDKGVHEGYKFVVPYEILKAPRNFKTMYLNKCAKDMADYRDWIEVGFDNDTAGYVMNQALRNILIVHGNYEAIDTFINKRICRRNTDETKYVASLMWKELCKTVSGDVFFINSGADCTGRGCREGHMCCKKPYKRGLTPDEFIATEWPALKEVE